MLSGLNFLMNILLLSSFFAMGFLTLAWLFAELFQLTFPVEQLAYTFGFFLIALLGCVSTASQLDTLDKES